MDFRAHNRTLFIFSVLKGFFLEKLYGYKCFKPVDTWTFGHRTPQHILLQSSQKFVIFLCLLNKWTHGALDTHQNYIFLFVGLKGFV